MKVQCGRARPIIDEPLWSIGHRPERPEEGCALNARDTQGRVSEVRLSLDEMRQIAGLYARLAPALDHTARLRSALETISLTTGLASDHVACHNCLDSHKLAVRALEETTG